MWIRRFGNIGRQIRWWSWRKFGRWKYTVSTRGNVTVRTHIHHPYLQASQPRWRNSLTKPGKTKLTVLVGSDWILIRPTDQLEAHQFPMKQEVSGKKNLKNECTDRANELTCTTEPWRQWSWRQSQYVPSKIKREDDTLLQRRTVKWKTRLLTSSVTGKKLAMFAPEEFQKRETEKLLAG